MTEALPTVPNRCNGTRKDGSPCQAPAVGASGFCWAHDPALATERTEARQRGGAHSAKVVRLRGAMPERLMPIFDRLERALQAVEEGGLTPGQAGAMASLARAMATLLEAGEMESRLRALEARLATEGHP